MKFCDVVVDLQSGDTGKGKVTHSLLRNCNYNLALRYNGGSNAGHTIYHNGRKIVTHQVPAGVFYGIQSLIGLGCVVNIPKIIEEIKMLNANGIATDGLIFIDKRAHLVTDTHMIEDSRDGEDPAIAIGTTKQGIGPAYKSKYGRTGIQIGRKLGTGPNQYFSIVDSMDIFNGARALAEGAQGFALDIDWGEYPYVTSSHCTVGSACLNGISPKKIRNIYGVAKAYETYVGAKDFGMDCDDLTKIQIAGNEFGSTTGRPRKCNWIDIDRLVYAARVNDIDHLIINKMDILDQVGKHIYIKDGKQVDAASRLGLVTAIKQAVDPSMKSIVTVISDTPYDI